jgi:hypothetical protein
MRPNVPHIIMESRRQATAVSLEDVKCELLKSLKEAVARSFPTACSMLQTSCRRNQYTVRETLPLYLVLQKSLQTVGQGRRFVVSSCGNPDIEIVITTQRDGTTDASLRVLE